ncbi:putative ribonucleotide reductase large subunit [Powai lake megavirus]|uniref:Ribonucleoside-diphosphate reductase n=1 Tax=Powai lake megavirus TaxID=1842663 RepID=A0A167RHS4_9VIRU|nr:putative ribonucleotide reductase large subunit [Powai lake megavirus]ANB50699.1 putative ribonucleotide reductase large subunit [Powai lake megavirus]
MNFKISKNSQILNEELKTQYIKQSTNKYQDIYSTTVDNVNNNAENLKIIVDGNTMPLYRGIIKQYIESISQKMEINDIDIDAIVNNVYPKLKDINTLDDIQNQIIASSSEMMIDHYNYPKIAVWILINNLHEHTHDDYFHVVSELRNNINKNGKHAPIVSDGFYKFVKKNRDEINKHFNYQLDYGFSIFGFRTLEQSYLKKVKGIIIERPQHLFMRVAIAIHYRNNDLKRVFETYEMLSQGYFTHATPTLFNAGTTHEQLSSCFLLGIKDDMAAIGDCWKDCAMISKYAGGIGVNVSNIRADGSYINSTQGTASGLRVLTVFNNISRYANQGGKRAGSFAIYIEPWHGDIYFFLDLKKNTGAETERARDLFLGLMINDIFIERVREDGIWSLMCPSECPNIVGKYGTEFNEAYLSYEKSGKYMKQISARDLWFKIMETQIETGVPYIVFKDAVNYKSNQINIGVINGSNLCVTGDTMILTSKGYQTIKSLENKKVDVWNGEEFSNVTVKKTGINQEIMQIEFSNGSIIKCTPYHKFYLPSGSKNKTMIKTEAKKLNIGDKLIRTSYPIIKKGSDKFKYPYTHGLFTADGTYSKSKLDEKQCSFNQLPGEKYCKRHIDHHQIINKHIILDENKCQASSYCKHPMISLYDEKKKLLKYLNYPDYYNLNENGNKITVNLYHDIAEKYIVPINYNIDIKLKWLAGLLDGDGCVIKNGDNISLQIASVNKDLLNDVKYMLQTLGCDPKVSLASDRNECLLPDGKGSKKLCKVNTVYRLLINSNDTYNLVNLGLKTHRLDLAEVNKPQRLASHFIKVTGIKKLKNLKTTYCFTEPKRNMGIFNGIITGNCSEIVEYSSADEYATCNLSSICLPRFIIHKNGIPEFDYNMLRKISGIMTRNLNNVIDINFYPVDKTRVSNVKHRPIGVGVQGLADVFAIFKTPFDSELARDINRKIFETIYFGCLEESMKLAKEFGAYETFIGSPISKGKFQFDLWNLSSDKLSGMWDWDNLMVEIQKYGVRNSLTTTCMPTASTSQIMGYNECFEPFTENIYSRSTLAGDYYVINKYLVQDLIDLGLWNSDMIDLIKYYRGSISKIPTIPQHIKDIYRTVWEIPQKSIIEMAADRAPFIDQTQSMNIFIESPSFAKLNSCLLYAHKLGLKTGMYYLRSKAATSADQFGIDIDKIKEIEARNNIVLEKIEDVVIDEPIELKPCQYIPKHLRKPGDCISCSS